MRLHGKSFDTKMNKMIQASRHPDDEPVVPDFLPSRRIRTYFSGGELRQNLAVYRDTLHISFETEEKHELQLLPVGDIDVKAPIAFQRCELNALGAVWECPLVKRAL